MNEFISVVTDILRVWQINSMLIINHHNDLVISNHARSSLLIRYELPCFFANIAICEIHKTPGSIKCDREFTKTHKIQNYRETSNISRTLVCNKIVDYSDAVGASPIGAAPTKSSYLT